MLLKNGFLLSAIVFLFLCVPYQLFANAVTEFTLVDADSNSDIVTIENNDIINLSNLPTSNLNIRADTNPSTVDSVTFNLSGVTSTSQTEGTAPYALWGDQSGNYNAGTFNLGAHSLTATPTVSAITGTPLTVAFTVIDNSSGKPSAEAGDDTYIFLPQSSLVLQGSGTDPDGSIASYQWNQLDGPNTANLSGQLTSTLTVSSLVEGIYTLRLTVTDNDNNTASDDVSIFVFPSTDNPDAPVPTGELKKWHKITLTFTGPETNETATPNPFTDYRLNVTFVNGPSIYTVPGYFAADGDAANTSASSGDKWRVHFAPDKTGVWNYVVSM